MTKTLEKRTNTMKTYREKTEHLAKLINAWLDGHAIEQRRLPNSFGSEWEYVMHPEWGSAWHEFRIEPKRIPFDLASCPEGLRVRRKIPEGVPKVHSANCVKTIPFKHFLLYVGVSPVALTDCFVVKIPWSELAEHWEQEDGSPCYNLEVE